MVIMSEYQPEDDGAQSSFSVASASTAESAPSPYRRSRFEGLTRRAALERRGLGKIAGLSPSHSRDEKKEDDLRPLHESLEIPRASSSATTESYDEITPRTPPSKDQRKGYFDGDRKPRAYGEYPFSHDEIRQSNVDTSSSSQYPDMSSLDIGRRRPPPQDVESNHEMLPPPNRPQHVAATAPTEKSLMYYRVVYRGVVAVLSAPDKSAARSGSYLGYGEIFASQSEILDDSTVAPKLFPRVDNSGRSSGESWQDAVSPTRTVSSTVPPPLPTIPDHDNITARDNILIIRVDRVVTGGYAMDAPDGSQAEPDAQTPKRSNAHYITATAAGGPSDDTTGRDSCELRTEGGCLGYLFSKQKDLLIVERLHSIPSSEEGKFLYKIISSTPLPILTGPSLDAPKTKAMVLPGTIHEASLRVSVDPDGDGTLFLRLSHRRGWIVDRKTSSRKGRPTQSVPVVKEVSSGGSSIDDASLSGLTSVATSIATPCSSVRRRHRLPRRRIDASKDMVDKTSLPPRQITGKFPVTSTPVKVGRSLADVSVHHEKTMTPSSNVSILSDDSSLEPNMSRHTVPTSPDISYSTNRSMTSASNAMATFFLMRVTAPRGVKILDAPQFQVNNLIHGKQAGIVGGVASSHMVSQFESNMGPPKAHHSIFQTMSGRHATTGPSKTGNPAVFDSSSRTRVLPRGVVFEASRRMESSGAYSQGAGLIKLSDNSGWAIVPRQDELDHQYRNYHGGVAGVKEGEASRAFEEVGNATVEALGSDYAERGHTTVWLRVTARTGLPVACPPPAAPMNDGDTSPTSSRGSSAISSAIGGSNHGSGYGGNESDVASSVGSAFLDAMFRTPKKKERENQEQLPPTKYPASIEKQLLTNAIACGTCVEVEKWQVDNSTNQEFARLRGGQGWLLMGVGKKPSVIKVLEPDLRFGSFWFRVQSARGIKVRLGPSRKASSIKSEDGVYYCFECGEFLRASEIMTVFNDEGDPTECFAKLYRNRHVRLYSAHEAFRQLPSLTTQAEWVQVFGRDELYLEECAVDPRIERHKQGWRYNVIPDSGVAIRRGPSFAAETSGIVLLGGESVMINERVSLAGSKMAWLRVLDGRGWIHDIADDGTEIMRAHSLRHRGGIASRPKKAPGQKEAIHNANAIIARLFHNENAPGDILRPPKDLRGRMQG